MIGVNSQIATGGAEQSAGIGFAVPVDTVEEVTRELIEHGRVDRAYLGVSTVGLTPELAQRLGLTVQSGALVLEVAPAGPAARAGLRGAGSNAATGALVPGGDVITSIDGQEITGPNDVAQAIGAQAVGRHQPSDGCAWRQRAHSRGQTRLSARQMIPRARPISSRLRRGDLERVV